MSLVHAYVRSLAGVPLDTPAPSLYQTANGLESYVQAMSATSADLAAFESTQEYQDYMASGANPETGSPSTGPTTPTTSPLLDTSSPAAYLASENAAVLSAMLNGPITSGEITSTTDFSSIPTPGITANPNAPEPF